jgi:hypothetical protein
MPNRNMTNFAKLAASPATLVDPGDYGGLSRHDYDELTTDGTETTGDRLFCGKLMPGERFHEAIVVFGALGAGRTLQLGDLGDDDRYLVATSVAAAGNAEARAATGFGYKNTTQQPIDLFLQIAGGALTAAQQIKIAVRKARD